MSKPIVILTGPTAVGKSGIAIEFAKKVPNVEILNADSLLFYKELSIGTAKPSFSERKEVPHHLIDVVSVQETFTVGDFYRKTQIILKNLLSNGKYPLIVGGSVFYIKSLLYGLWNVPSSGSHLKQSLEGLTLEALYQKLLENDPESAKLIGKKDRYRLTRALEVQLLTLKTVSELKKNVSSLPDPRFEVWVIDRLSQDLEVRISKRTNEMIEKGWIQEVETLKTLVPSSRLLLSVGYRQIDRYLQGISPKGRKVLPGILGLKNEIELATRQLVKSQRTFLKTLPQTKAFILDQDRLKLDQSFFQWVQNG